MHLSDKFCYRKIANKYLLVAVRKNNLTNSLIEINRTTADILLMAMEKMNKQQIVSALIDKYSLSSEYFSILENAINDLIDMEILIDHEY